MLLAKISYMRYPYSFWQGWLLLLAKTAIVKANWHSNWEFLVVFLWWWWVPKWYLDFTGREIQRCLSHKNWIIYGFGTFDSSCGEVKVPLLVPQLYIMELLQQWKWRFVLRKNYVKGEKDVQWTDQCYYLVISSHLELDPGPCPTMKQKFKNLYPQTKWNTLYYVGYAVETILKPI
jgi:hypothetical protein